MGLSNFAYFLADRGARFDRRVDEREQRNKARRAARRARTTSDCIAARGFGQSSTPVSTPTWAATSPAREPQ
jgi:hypothetical protein